MSTATNHAINIQFVNSATLFHAQIATTNGKKAAINPQTNPNITNTLRQTPYYAFKRILAVTSCLDARTHSANSGKHLKIDLNSPLQHLHAVCLQTQQADQICSRLLLMPHTKHSILLAVLLNASFYLKKVFLVVAFFWQPQ